MAKEYVLLAAAETALDLHPRSGRIEMGTGFVDPVCDGCRDCSISVVGGGGKRVITDVSNHIPWTVCWNSETNIPHSVDQPVQWNHRMPPDAPS